jgi:hypothetical protein
MNNLTGERNAFPTPEGGLIGMNNRFYIAAKVFPILVAKENNPCLAAVFAFRCADAFIEEFERTENERNE